MFNKLKKLFYKGKRVSVNSNPEDDYIITITQRWVKVDHPKRKTESIRWEDIDEIWLVNTDEGPFLPDVWLVLCGKGEGCTLPQGAKGFDEIYDIVSKYENFNFDSFIASMSCTENKRFALWKRE